MSNYGFLLKGHYGSYWVTENLGEGTYGSVWKGIRNEDREPVAIKVIIDDEGSMLIRREVNILEKVSRFPDCFPYIACIYDYIFLKDQNRHYIVMELVYGKSILNINRNEIPNVFLQLVMGLEHIHSKGIVHNDIKPDNILITEDNQVKILDLGLGCFVADRSCSSIKGTPRYMDPRSVYKGYTSSPKSDIFSLGQTMYYVITRQYPSSFNPGRGCSVRTYVDTVKSMYSMKLKTLSKIKDVDQRIIRIVEHMLNPLNSNLRPSTKEILEVFDMKIEPFDSRKNRNDLISFILEQSKILYETEDDFTCDRETCVNMTVKILKGVKYVSDDIKKEVLERWE